MGLSRSTLQRYISIFESLQLISIEYHPRYLKITPLVSLQAAEKVIKDCARHKFAKLYKRVPRGVKKCLKKPNKGVKKSDKGCQKGEDLGHTHYKEIYKTYDMSSKLDDTSAPFIFKHFDYEKFIKSHAIMKAEEVIGAQGKKDPLANKSHWERHWRTCLTKYQNLKTIPMSPVELKRLKKIRRLFAESCDPDIQIEKIIKHWPEFVEYVKPHEWSSTPSLPDLKYIEANMLHATNFGKDVPFESSILEDSPQQDKKPWE